MIGNNRAIHHRDGSHKSQALSVRASPFVSLIQVLFPLIPVRHAWPLPLREPVRVLLQSALLSPALLLFLSRENAYRFVRKPRRTFQVTWYFPLNILTLTGQSTTLLKKKRHE